MATVNDAANQGHNFSLKSGGDQARGTEGTQRHQKHQKRCGMGKAHLSWRIFIKRIQHSESTQFACSLVQTEKILWHRGIPWHLRKFRGVACYSAACRKPWALLITKCCQQLTDDRRLSITLSVQLCAQHDDDWV